jgi:DNA-directed RNA polymerase specialized sigma subunit
MSVSGIDSRELGQIALEVLIARRTIEDVIENKPQIEQKEIITEALRVVKELERSVVQLYFLLGTARAIPSQNKLYEQYITQSYLNER